jgi:outer membrane biogenesis lipoprotein LolB
MLSAAIISSLLLAACSAKAPETTESTPTDTQMEQTTSPESTEMTTGEETSDAMQTEEKVASVTTSYQSPAALEPVEFKLTVDSEGVITKAETVITTNQEISKMRQEAFAKELPTAVVGKKLSELTEIDRVGGSSLTTGAFNKALSDLKSQI